MNTDFLRFGISNACNKMAEMLYFNLGIDRTRPVQLYGIVNYACNARCLMCSCWQQENVQELPASVWINALKSLKKTGGLFHINFSGGEPLVKHDFIEILEFCSREKILAGFTTNGVLLTKKNVDRLLSLDLANINISIDSMEERIHDTMRGIPGLLAKVKKNIEYLVSEKKRLNKKTQIVLKPTVGAYNLKGLDRIVEYAENMQLTGVNFQPVFKWTPKAEKMFKIDSRELEDTINLLVRMKKQNRSILNSPEALRNWRFHFEDTIPIKNTPCSVALRNLTIFPDGSIFLCVLRDAKIGNIEVDDIGKVWREKRVRELRKELVNCKRICSASCDVKRSWIDYFNLFIRFIRG